MDWHEVRSRWEAGESATKIGADVNLSPRAIANRAEQSGWVRDQPRRYHEACRATSQLCPPRQGHIDMDALMPAPARQDVVLLWWEEQLCRDGVAEPEAIRRAAGPLTVALLSEVNARRTALGLSPFEVVR